ncbi:biorientation of chromosomes in cell division protein 1-like 1 isoform X2 [Drosophila subpulchrella]|uniref:biorientation of chromosomes in cell division protein 1-like 1 isoform X2 n=1 Tax=Drosophila subpulchrella TaxID=1486046 RepID=UPI0018A17892|nr:biorientation of chromosomes in cell division protein 1-like 1 isoform X2 [Drosophila subpulchrella]
MFRFYKLYSLYMNNMSSGLTWPREWCLCEKLPRAVLHIPVNRHLLCEVCGLARRPQGEHGSSSDEDAYPGRKYQRNLLAQRHNTEEPKKGQMTRVKVAIRAKKPRDHRNCRCGKCGGLARAEAGQEGTGGPGGPGEEMKSKLYSGRHGLYSRPKGMLRRQQEPTAPPPSSPSPPSSPLPPRPPPPPSSGSSRSEMPSLVARAHDVFSRKNHLNQSYSHLFVNNFIPLQSPITDTFGGAISKRSLNSSLPPRSHRSRPLPPLSKVVTNILASPKTLDDREKGGGLSPPKSKDSLDTVSQFCPFEHYEGPSEDALVVSSARCLLHRPKSLYIEPRKDLPNNRIENLDLSSEPSNENLSGIFYMTNSVRKNLIKTINHIGFDCSSSSKTSSLNNPISNPPKEEPEKHKDLASERSSIIASIMDQLFNSKKKISEDDQIEKTPELDELSQTISNQSSNNPETASLLSDVSTEQTVYSSNKTKPFQDYSKLFSKTLSDSSWEREFCRIDESSPNASGREVYSSNAESKSTCLKCGNIRHQEGKDPKTKTGFSRIPRRLDESSNRDKNLIGIKRNIGNAIKQKLNSVRPFSGKQEQNHEKESLRMEDRADSMNKSTPKIIAREAIPKGINTKGQRICQTSQSPCKIHHCVKPKMQNNTGPPVITVQPRNNSTNKLEEYLKKNVRTTAKDANLIRTRIPVNNFRVCRHKEPSFSWGVVETFEIISHMCREIPKLQVATFVRELVNTSKGILGYIKESLLSDEPPFSLYEFRIPDINLSDLQAYRDSEDNAHDDSGSETPIAHLATPKLPGLSFRQRRKHRKPVWPAHPIKYQSRKIQYEELKFSINTQQNGTSLEPNENLVHHKKKMFKEEKIFTSVYEAQNFSQSAFFFDSSPEKDTKSKPIQLIKTNLSDGKSSQSDIFESQSERMKWDTSDGDLESLRPEKSLKVESKLEIKDTSVADNPLEIKTKTKEGKEITQDLLNQAPQNSSSKVSYDIRRKIDKSMQMKLKKMMSKPIKLLNSKEAESVVKFLEPYTNKLASTEENKRFSNPEALEGYEVLGPASDNNNKVPATETLKDIGTAELEVKAKPLDCISSTSKYNSSIPKQREEVGNEEEKGTASSNCSCEKSDLPQKPLRLITNMSSSSEYESKCFPLETRVEIETESDAGSEPVVTQRTTEYEGLPNLNWQVITMGLPKQNEPVEDASESIGEEEYACPIHKCGHSLNMKTFASHFDQFHRHKSAKNASPQEYCHRVVEGLPKQFFFDAEFLTKGNSFVSLLFYSSLKKDLSVPIRDYPLALLAAPQRVNNGPTTGIFFWLVGYPSCAKLQAKLTVCDPLEHVGRSRIIRPRDISQSQDPSQFLTNSKYNLLIKIPHKKQRKFQISVVIDEKH